MDHNLLKTGGCSIILGKNHYKGYFPEKLNKLIKVTQIMNSHNEFNNLSIIRKIRNYQEYYTIPDNELVEFSPEHDFNKYLKILTQDKNINIFNTHLYGFYIDYAGEMDVLDSINNFINYDDRRIWNSVSSILKLSKHIIEGLNFLHKNKICHLDIKAENIMINFSNKSFRIIDFGFSSVEPFDDYISNIRGTPRYFPKYYANLIEPGFPKIEANDMVYVNKVIPIHANRKLVYKIDSYCLGRVINMLSFHYQDKLEYSCCMNFEINNNRKLHKIITLLLENDVNKRVTIEEIYELNII
jgi:serine/threonine protein kinase